MASNSSSYCFYCQKLYSTRKNLNRHIEEVHDVDVNQSSGVSEESQPTHNFKCLEGCEISFRINSDLRNHLENNHGIDMQKETLQFDNMDEFISWLNNIQKLYKAAYIKPRGATKNHQSVVTYYDCNCSGKARILNDGNRKRMLQVQGSRKIDYACTSQIIMTKTNENIQVTFFKSHYGHSIDLQHIPLTCEERSRIAIQISSGVTMNKILQENRENVYMENPERINLISRKDLHNIKTSFNINIQDGVRHKEDAVSVDLWVKECEQMQHNPVLFYKPQGAEHPELNKQDFCLVIMNKCQEYMVKSYGHKVVCVDSTHGTNSYDFELTTLMVIDNFGEGFPGACLISNRKDTKVFKVFFECIKLKTGVLKSKTFMTDVTTVFYNAWVTVMGPVEMQIFCTWHVDRAWQKQLQIKISDPEKRKIVYQMLKVLQETLDRNEFHSLLSTVIDSLLEDDETKCFGIYFSQQYATIFKQWAYCYRQNAGVNTNMHLESMHKVVKYLYLNAKKTKRLDKGLHALITFIRDKVVDQTIKNIKGKNTAHIQKINKRHRTAIGTDFTSEAHPENTDVWSVVSSNDKNSIHIISRNSELETPCCQLICTICKICIHSFSCTCTDFLIGSTICKHIHYISLNYVSKDRCKNMVPSTSSFPIAAESQSLVVPTSCIPEVNFETKISQEVGLLLSKIGSVKNRSVLSQVYNTIRNANCLINSSLQETIPSFSEEKNSEPPNKKIKKQLTFFSTKKNTKQNNKTSCSKPTINESTEIKNILSNKVQFISRCSSNDHCYL